MLHWFKVLFVILAMLLPASLQGKLAPQLEPAIGSHNFEVQDFHTYFVGKSGVWVHNTDKAPCEKIYSVFFQKAKELGGTENLRSERFSVLLDTKVALTAEKSIPDAS